MRSTRAALACLLFVSALLAPPPGLAQLRSIPVDVKRGEIRHLQESIVDIDGTPYQLAPGAQIRDASNLIVLPTALPAGALVKYQLDAQGQVRRVWILTPAEAARPDPDR